MRVVRVVERPSNLRAAFMAFGQGDSDVGGVALMGVTPPGVSQPVEAIVIRPDAIFVVLGLELPGPAKHLEAPLHGQWRADGWRIGESATAANPAADALAAAETIADSLRRSTHVTVPIEVILAVGPYAGSVTVPDDDGAGLVHVLHPRPASARQALTHRDRTVDPSRSRCTIEQTRGLLRTLLPNTCEHPGDLAAEGFFPGDSTSAHPPRSELGAPQQPDRPASSADGTRARWPRPWLWLPVAGIALIVLASISAVGIAVATTKPTARQALQPPAQPHEDHTIHQVTFTPVDTAGGLPCTEHTFGDVQATVERLGCTEVWLGSYTAEFNGHQAVVSVAEFDLRSGDDADALAGVADTPGSGGAHDLATATGQWPGSAPGFGDAVSRSHTQGGTVRLVLASLHDAQSMPHPVLSRIVDAAAEMPAHR